MTHSLSLPRGTAGPEAENAGGINNKFRFKKTGRRCGRRRRRRRRGGGGGERGRRRERSMGR